MKIKFLIFLFLGFFSKAYAETYQEAPNLEFVMQLNVKIGEPFSIKNLPQGNRTVIPILGGTFDGPELRGEVLNGGADYQMTSIDGSFTTLDAIYSIKTDDGFYINVRNRGIISITENEKGEQDYYFDTSPVFEAPGDSPYAWLNRAIFICRPDFSKGEGITLNVWKVR